MNKSSVELDALDLATRTRNALVRARITTVDQLRSVADAELLAIPGIGREGLTEVRTKIEASGRRRVELMPESPLSFIRSLRLTDRDWVVLSARIGLGSRSTLEVLGQAVGVTRERIRQLQVRAEARLMAAANRGRFDQAMDTLESRLPLVDEPLPASAVRSGVADALKSNESEVPSLEEKLITSVRSLVEQGATQFTMHWPVTSAFICFGLPVIDEHPLVDAALKKARADEIARSRRWTYAELGELVLEDAGRPMHWHQMARAAEDLHLRTEFAAQAFANSIFDHDELFARVGQGTYALKRWGFDDVAYYPDLIAAAMEGAGRAVSFGEIAQFVRNRRPISEASLTLFLDLHRRFYRSIDGRYGLREWLSEVDKQTLRTPPGFVEAAASRSRIGRG